MTEKLINELDQFLKHLDAYVQKIDQAAVQGRQLLSQNQPEALKQLQLFLKTDPVLSDQLAEWQQLKRAYLELVTRSKLSASGLST